MGEGHQEHYSGSFVGIFDGRIEMNEKFVLSNKDNTPILKMDLSVCSGFFVFHEGQISHLFLSNLAQGKWSRR